MCRFSLFYEIFHPQREGRRVSSVHLDNFCWSSTKRNKSRRQKARQWSCVKCWWWINFKSEALFMTKGWGINWFQRFFLLWVPFKTDKRIVHSADWIFSASIFHKTDTTGAKTTQTFQTTSCWNSLPYQFVDGDENEKKKKKNLFEGWWAFEIRQWWKEKWKNISRQKKNAKLLARCVFGKEKTWLTIKIHFFC